MFVQAILERHNRSSLLYVIWETIPSANRGREERISNEVGISSELLYMVRVSEIIG